MGVSQFEQDLVAVLPKLKVFALSFCRQPALADDLVQETAMRALAAQDHFDGVNIEAWLFTICRNLYRSLYRRQLKRETELSLVVEDHTYADIPSPEQECENRLELERFLRGMSPDDYPMIEAVAGGSDYQELAEMFGIKEGTVKSRLSRLRNRGRQIINRPAPLSVDQLHRRRHKPYKRTAKWLAMVASGSLSARIREGRARAKAVRMTAAQEASNGVD